MQEFYNRFEELSNMISGMPGSFLQNCFEFGLRLDIQRKVQALQPQHLLQAFQLAKLMEDRLGETQVITRKDKLLNTQLTMQPIGLLKIDHQQYQTNIPNSKKNNPHPKVNPRLDG